MHWQSANPSRARDHRISLMPMERPEGELPVLAGAALILGVLVIVTVLIAACGGF
jgi:hypothetical protein